MTAFGIVPPEPPRIFTLDDCAPFFVAEVRNLLDDLKAQGYPPLIFESIRTPERQAWLYGFSREYDDGRGEVTRAATALNGWHAYGLAVDIIHRDRGWKAEGFFTAMRAAMPKYGLAPCMASDKPHVQWGKCRKTPSAESRKLFAAGGREAVWKAVGAI